MLLICISTKYAEKMKRNQVGEKLEKICSVQQEVKAHTILALIQNVCGITSYLFQQAT